MSRDDRILLRELVLCLEKIIEYSSVIDSIDNCTDGMRLDAIVRNIIIIGEVAKALKEDTKKMFPMVEWNKIIGFRNIVVHEYFDIDLEILEEVVFQKVPELLSRIKKVL